MQRIHLYITGRVQGVFFRVNAQKMATGLGLAGWVRNTEDGGVELVAEGEKAALEKAIAWCRKGPPAARVDGVKVRWEEANGEFKGCLSV